MSLLFGDAFNSLYTSTKLFCCFPITKYNNRRNLLRPKQANPNQIFQVLKHTVIPALSVFDYDGYCMEYSISLYIRTLSLQPEQKIANNNQLIITKQYPKHILNYRSAQPLFF